MRLFLVRHGETLWNVERKLQGHADIPLNELGKTQALHLRPLLEALLPNSNLQIFSSDLRRAQQTCQISLPETNFTTSHLLREIFLGQAEGRTREQVAVDFAPDIWARWSSSAFSDYSVCFPGGENRNEGIERLFLWISAQQAAFENKPKIAVVGFTHGLLLRSFAQWAADLQTPQFTTPNCCIYEWELQTTSHRLDMDPKQRPRLRQITFLPEESLIL